MATTKAPSSERYQTLETGCECGRLIAKVRCQDLELKCKGYKRIVVIFFPQLRAERQEHHYFVP